MSYLLYASNLHIGGAVQVAASVISELSQAQGDYRDLSVWVSTEVDQNLKDLKVDTTLFIEYRIVNHWGIRALFSPDRKLMEAFSCILVLFGPLYFPKLKTKTIVGFAQAWIINPATEAYDSLSLIQRMISKVKFGIQKWFFMNADQFVVELQHVKDGLMHLKLGDTENIHVVPNCVSSVYLDPSLWRPIDLWPQGSMLYLGFLGRNYSHKNTHILPEIKRVLMDVYGIHSQIFVTFTDDEWLHCDEYFKKEITNIGPLSIAQCPIFYQKLDGVIFPSLLECFSATPLEALAMERPLFASNRPFVWDICADFAIYFDPLSPMDAAAKIAKYFQGFQDKKDLSGGKKHALNFSSPRSRAFRYLELLKHAG
ncbi:glycosyltransferase [Polynucleobacter sp. UK-Kesae-W10]|uniref:glycosyltransferase n=1 Tax=Polynucleobacter sp. UK-Kesae-W10 TaxID=1819738 RepID=UPI001C0C6BB7|nr:glycosyltransferase [Polynucleobacter sp. UK-Kesae-W10]MBU3576942.1 glycosyltransferase [Polynucleobacter sp. UK-Kesae-W10]